MPSTPLRPLGHHELLILLIQLAVLVLGTRLLGEVMRKWRQSPVIGELLAGVLLGPSLFGLLLPDLQAAIFPRSQAQADLLSVLTWLGVLFLLIVTGLETDLNLIISKGRTALTVSTCGIVLTFLTGFALGQSLPDDFLVASDKRLVFSLFIATAMSITAVPVIAKVLVDMGLVRRDIGQIVLAAGMTDDTVGWVLLSVVAALASGTFSARGPLLAMSGAVMFVVVSLTVGRPLVARLFLWVDDTFGGHTVSFTTLLVAALLAAALTSAMGIEPVLGAFVVGILAGQSPRFSREAGHALELATAGFFAPVFFGAAGLKVNLLGLLEPRTFVVGILVLGVACVGKFVGVYGGARLSRLSHWEGLALGSAMNARGAMEIIVATIGLSLGVLTQSMYSIIVMVAITTSLMAPPLLRWTLRHVVMGDDEAARLKAEEQARLSFVRNLRRVLVPSRGGENVQLGAQLVSHIGHRIPLEVTALYAETGAHEAEAKQAVAAVSRNVDAPGVKAKTVRGRDVADIIIGEARRGYQLLVLGATEAARGGGALFNSIVDRIVQEAPCATVVVRAGENAAETPLRHLLVPTIGTEYSRHAVEVACTVAAQVEALVTIVYVVTTPPDEVMTDEQLQQLGGIAQEIIDGQADLGRGFGAQVDTHVLFGRTSEQAIFDFIEAHPVDLVVVGSNLRPISGRAFFGRRVEALLAKAPCPVAVVSSR